MKHELIVDHLFSLNVFEVAPHLIRQPFGAVVRLRLHEVVDVAQKRLHVIPGVEDNLICN